MKCQCQNCGREFELNRMWQKFCSKQCQQKWNKDRYRAEAVEDGRVLRGNRFNGQASPTAEQRKKASEVVARIVKERQGRIVRRI
jgi:endogenous inhibitor of DNA gyrase (YacG/DUF329 family)